MTTYVPDSKTKRWVIISPVRNHRPDQSHSDKVPIHLCPFCPGNEHLTPPEIAHITKPELGITNQELGKNTSSWCVRVIPNKYPITDIHEVIIHNPDHVRDMSLLTPLEVSDVITMYQDRLRVHETDGQAIIFCNHGKEGGASLSHPHSQLVVVPNQVPIDAISKEPIDHIIKETDHYVACCPKFSQWPYELWIAPKRTGLQFLEASPEEVRDLSALLPSLLRSLHTIYDETSNKEDDGGQFAYNYYISPGSDYRIRVIPRFIHRAGFELATEISVNQVNPAEAATEVRSHLT